MWRKNLRCQIIGKIELRLQGGESRKTVLGGTRASSRGLTRQNITLRHMLIQTLCQALGNKKIRSIFMIFKGLFTQALFFNNKICCTFVCGCKVFVTACHASLNFVN